jgi:hypothetical protein
VPTRVRTYGRVSHAVQPIVGRSRDGARNVTSGRYQPGAKRADVLTEELVVARFAQFCESLDYANNAIFGVKHQDGVANGIERCDPLLMNGFQPGEVVGV